MLFEIPNDEGSENLEAVKCYYLEAATLEIPNLLLTPISNINSTSEFSRSMVQYLASMCIKFYYYN